VSYNPDDSSITIEKQQEYRESFLESLQNYHTRIQDKIRALRAVNHLSSPVLEDYLRNLKNENQQKIFRLNSEEMKEYQLYNQTIKNPDAIPYQTKNRKVARVIFEETEMYHHREKVRRASNEMMLVYLIIIFEEYLTDTLTALFRKKPSILKTSQKSITYEEAFKYRNLTELLNSIGRKIVDSEIGSDIEELGKYLNWLSITVNTREDWDQFKEHFYRRNVIVHNSGYPDSKYIQKTGYRGPIDWLEVDNKYLKTAFDIFESYSDELRNLFENEYGKKKRKTKPKKGHAEGV
jgi:hypothetical protein